MQLRLAGTQAECDDMVAKLRTVTRVISARARRKRPDDTSELVLMDVETR